MSSQSSNDGSYVLDVTFALGTDVKHGAGARAETGPPSASRRCPTWSGAIGVTVKKRSPDILLVANLSSDNDPETGRPYF